MGYIIAGISSDKCKQDERQTKPSQDNVAEEYKIIGGSNPSILAKNDFLRRKMITNLRQQEAG